MGRLTRFGILFVLSGIFLLTVTSNLFYNTMCSFTYIILPLPLLGVFYIFKERKNYNIEHSRLSALSLTLMITFFLSYLALGLLHVFFLGTKGDYRAVTMVLYSVEASYFLVLTSCIISIMGLGNERTKKVALAAAVITAFLIIVSLILVQSPTEEYIGGLKDIRRDTQSYDFQKKAMYIEEVEKYNENLFVPRLPQVAAGILTMLSVILLGREEIGGFKEELKMRFRGALR